MTAPARRTLKADFSAALSAELERSVSSELGVPGVAAGVCDRDGLLHHRAVGVRRLGTSTAMTMDTVCTVLSATKPVTTTACLQLVDDGELDLDAPAERYLPALGEVEVLDGFRADGSLRLRPPRRAITTRMLLNHTAGFAYDNFNQTYLRLTREHGQPPIVTGTQACLRVPLVRDPGECWEYGLGVDWAGQIVEAITTERLGPVMRERIFSPLGMPDTAFTPTTGMLAKAATVHRREPDGSVVTTDFALPRDPEVEMGGHGLYSSPSDYLRFLHMWLADGAGPRGQVLRAETVAKALIDGLNGMAVRPLPGLQPQMTHPLNTSPEVTAGWGLGFLITREPSATGRPAGSASWGGLANSFFWIDRRTGIAGFWCAQVLPFLDPGCLDGYRAWETAVYRELVAG